MPPVPTNPLRLLGRIGTVFVAGVLAFILLGFVFSSWRNINPGFVGIVFDKANHTVTTGALDPGWAFINPFTKAIQEYPVTIQTYPMVQSSDEGGSRDDSIKVQSNEGQQINLDVVIQYQVEKSKASQLYTDWGGHRFPPSKPAWSGSIRARRCRSWRPNTPGKKSRPPSARRWLRTSSTSSRRSSTAAI